MPYPIFDRNQLKLQPLQNRKHDLGLSQILALDSPLSTFNNPDIKTIAQRLKKAKASQKARMLIMGAHVIRAGVSLHVIDLMERGLINHIAMNGAGPIHDWEFALIGATTESVAHYVRSGEFGLWQETGKINDVVAQACTEEMGMGEGIGKAIYEGNFPYKHLSILAAGYRLRIPVTVHIGIGYDIIHEHPNCDGAKLGQASYTDFLCFAQTITDLEGGVVLNFGSAVMGPEVYLKALTMARNVAAQHSKKIANFTTAVFDLIPLDGDIHKQAPKSDPRYYYRPWKTILVRTVADGGESFYVAGDHRHTIQHLHHHALETD